MVRKIVEWIPDELLQEDLEKYRQRALQLGASDARIITTDMIIIDERVRAKCMYPKCASYNTNANCPPHAIDLDTIRKIVNRYRYAIFTRIVVPSEQMAGDEAREKRLMIPSRKISHEMIARIESEAFYDGYYLALGFADGPCKSLFCPEIECSALVPGSGCRHKLKARTAMEGAGMDAYLMAAKVGWDMYPIGSSLSPSLAPHGTILGLVLIY